MDLKTKLCIRDSLYRLARSAEQRHNHENLNGSFCGDDRDTSGLAIEGANKYVILCTSNFILLADWHINTYGASPYAYMCACIYAAPSLYSPANLVDVPTPGIISV